MDVTTNHQNLYSTSVVDRSILLDEDTSIREPQRVHSRMGSGEIPVLGFVDFIALQRESSHQHDVVVRNTSIVLTLPENDIPKRHFQILHYCPT
jgi:hypothetical protein